MIRALFIAAMLAAGLGAVPQVLAQETFVIVPDNPGGGSGVGNAVATSNGTTALHLCLATLEIGAGDEVLVPDLTFVSTANVVRYTGATPVLVDSEPRTWGMDPADARRKITPRTRAIIPVHLYGHPVDMDPLLALAAEHGLDIVEDAAEAHGARYKGHRVGALGRIGAFSRLFSGK